MTVAPAFLSIVATHANQEGTMRVDRVMLCAVLAVVAGCGEQQSPVTAAEESQVQQVSGGNEGRRAPMERLARRVALAMADPDFRQYVKSSLDGSPYVERKLPFSRFLGKNGERGRSALAHADPQGAEGVVADLEAAGNLEFYFPVPAHRAAWAGDENLLVATEVNDHEAPVAFDTHGRRTVLDPKTPPATPVLAVVPQETDFDAPRAALQICDTCDTSGGGPGLPPPPTNTPPPPGLYLNYFNVTNDFEGWLKGSPEFEIHILAPKLPGDTVTYKTVWCIGEKSVADQYWDTDALTWRGDLMLYGQDQLDFLHKTYPGQDLSIFLLEDDDGACEIRMDRNLVKGFFDALTTFTHDYKAARDTNTTAGKKLKAARSGYDLITAAADLFQTNDDLIGTAIANSVVGMTGPSEAQWAVIGKNNTRNGWLGLSMH